MNAINSSMFKWLSISALVILIDQLTKQVAENSLELYERITVMPLFNITLAYNEGAAFSFLSDAGGWQRWFFVLLSIAISTVLLVWLRKTDNKIESWAISLVLGGAIGNLIDRLLFGHVIDFLDFYYDTHHWPAFNVADMAIVGGVGLLILATFMQKDQTRE